MSARKAPSSQPIALLYHHIPSMACMHWDKVATKYVMPLLLKQSQALARALYLGIALRSELVACSQVLDVIIPVGNQVELLVDPVNLLHALQPVSAVQQCEGKLALNLYKVQ